MTDYTIAKCALILANAFEKIADAVVNGMVEANQPATTTSTETSDLPAPAEEATPSAQGAGEPEENYEMLDSEECQNYILSLVMDKKIFTKDEAKDIMNQVAPGKLLRQMSKGELNQVRHLFNGALTARQGVA